MNDLERRYTAKQVELRIEMRGTEEQRRIGGYAAMFNRLSRNLGGFVERVAPVAFNRSRGQDWPEAIARYNHNDDMLLGTAAAGTLRLAIDETGLDYTVTPPQARGDILELVERGDVAYSSFAFRTIEDEWGTSDQGYPMRTLLSVQLVDVAPVVSPAYLDTTAGLRSLAKHFEADLDEVKQLAAEDELRKFFVRTDTTGRVEKPRLLGAAARMELLGKEQDPLAQ